MEKNDKVHSIRMTDSLTIEQMINDFNWAKIEGREFVGSEKNTFCEQITMQVDLRQDIVMEFTRAYRAPFYVYNRKENLNDFHTFNGYKPKTMLFYSNYCELELLRMAYLLDVLGEDKKWIYENTKQRIQSNCFGRFCPTGECFETSIAVLRFVATIFPEETEWIGMYMKNITVTILSGDKKIPYQTKLYFIQTLYEMDTEASRKYLIMLAQYIQHLEKCVVRENSHYRTTNEQIIKNCIVSLGEDYIKIKEL